jgi:N-acetylmuramoyl-L-alanine amidase
MRKLFLIAGHGGTDPGASGNGYLEKNLTIELRKLIDAELKKIGITAIVDSDENYLAHTMRWLRGKFGSKDVILDIHWNASANNTANGSEIIIPNEASIYEAQFATALLKVFTDVGFKGRGVKRESETARGSLAIMKPNAENLLIEVCFVSNLQDMRLYENSKHLISKRLAYVIKEYLKK